METLLSSTPPMRIGKHDWRCIAYEEDDAFGRTPDGTWTRGHTRRYTRYEWRRCGRLALEHLKGMANDTYNGLPRTLSRLYHRHEDAIQSALGRLPVQASLAL